jgi:hypothetical protein
MTPIWPRVVVSVVLPMQVESENKKGAVNLKAGAFSDKRKYLGEKTTPVK